MTGRWATDWSPPRLQPPAQDFVEGTATGLIFRVPSLRPGERLALACASA